MNKPLFLCFVLLFLVVGAGCKPKAEPLLSNTQDDTEHEHRHLHGAGHDHEHDHNEFSGAHEHEHEHGHRHGDPMYGGDVHPIGHSHHTKGETHYHAEVSRRSDGGVQLNVLCDVNGEATPCLPKEKEISAYAGAPDGGPTSVREVLFELVSEETSEYRARIPEVLTTEAKLEFVVPKITLGGERLSFSFDLKQRVNENEDSASMDVAAVQAGEVSADE